MKTNKLISGFFLIAILVFLSGCIDSAENTTKNNADVSVKTKEIQTKEFRITAKQWEFNPSTITINQGDKVKLYITSVDVLHGISINTFGINKNLEPGQTTLIEFTADKKGNYSFFCSVYCGEKHGNMTGEIIVN